MGEQEHNRRIPFEVIRLTQQELERRGYHFVPVEREHTEALVTEPLVVRLHSQIKKRHFAKLAGRLILTFSGYDEDPREIYEIPEIRAYFQKLDKQLSELPALMSFKPEIGFNGPGLYLMLLGEVDGRVDRREDGVFDVHIKGADRILTRALHRIRKAGAQYGLSPQQRNQVLAAFIAGSQYRFSAD